MHIPIKWFRFYLMKLTVQDIRELLKNDYCAVLMDRKMHENGILHTINLTNKLTWHFLQGFSPLRF